MASVSYATPSFSAEATSTLTATATATENPTSEPTATTTTTTPDPSTTTFSPSRTTDDSTTSPSYTTNPSTSSTSIPTSYSGTASSPTLTQSTSYSTRSSSTHTTTSNHVSPTIIPSEDSGDLSTGAIVGIAIGSAVVLALIVLAFFFVRRSYKKRRKLEFDSNVIFSSVGMTEHRPPGGGAGHSTNQNRYSNGGLNSSLGSTRPSEDVMNTSSLGLSGYPGRSDNNQMFHPESDLGVYGGYEQDDSNQRYPQGYYHSDHHQYNPNYPAHSDQVGDVTYQQHHYPNGYQTEGGWYGTDGYYGAEQDYNNGGYDGYYDDQQYASDIHGHHMDPRRVHYARPDGEAVVSGAAAVHGSQVVTEGQYHDENLGRPALYYGTGSVAQASSEGVPGPLDSPTIKVDSTLTAGSRTETGSGAEDEYSKRFSQQSLSQISMDSAGQHRRNPHQLIPETK